MKFFLISLLLPIAVHAAGVHRRLSLIRLESKSFQDFAHVKNLAARDCEVEIISQQTLSDRHTADVIVPGNLKHSFVKTLQNRGITWNILEDDILALLEKESQKRDLSISTIHDDFLPLDKIEEYLNGLQSSHSDLVQLHRLGSTHENRNLIFVQIGKCNDCSAIFIEAGIHAREWLSPAVALNIIDKLVTNESNHHYTTDLTWFILPVTNPDGYVETHTTKRHRLWRKNRRPPVNNETCHGVDLNRNFDYDWNNDEGSSSHPANSDYRGPAAASEPETQAIKKFVKERLDKIRSYVAVHTFGQLFMYPCPPEKTGKCFDDDDEVVQLANEAAKAMKEQGGEAYRVGSPSGAVSYYASGTSDQWAHYVENIKFSYTIELRPKGRSALNFIIDRAEISPTSKEIWTAFSVLADAILKKYPKAGLSNEVQ